MIGTKETILLILMNQISKLNKRKAKQSYEIPTKVTIESVDIFSDVLCNNFNNSIVSSNFPQCLKLTDITPLHNKEKNILKGNYRPVSILLNLSKIFEKLCLHK